MRQIFSVREVPTLAWSSPSPFNLRPRPLTLFYLSFGLVIFGLGEAMLIASGAGVSPWTVFAQGIAFNTGWSIGFSTMIVSFAILLLWIPLRQKPGIGTILNALIIAFMIDFSLPYLIFLVRNLTPARYRIFVNIFGGGDHFKKILLPFDSPDIISHQKTVPEGFHPGCGIGYFIGSGEDGPNVYGHFLFPIPVNFLIQDGQQGILNCRACFPDFVQKYDIRPGEIFIRQAFVFIFILQLFNVRT